MTVKELTTQVFAFLYGMRSHPIPLPIQPGKKPWKLKSDRPYSVSNSKR